MGGISFWYKNAYMGKLVVIRCIFARLLTADHKIVAEKNSENASKEFDRVALVI